MAYVYVVYSTTDEKEGPDAPFAGICDNLDLAERLIDKASVVYPGNTYYYEVIPLNQSLMEGVEI